MVYYTNYKKVARITLKSEDATKKVLYNRMLMGVNTPIIGNYSFNINLPTLKFNKHTRIAVEKFSIIHTVPSYVNGNYCEIGHIYIKNFSKPLNNFHSSKSNNGLCVMTDDIGHNTTIYNDDIINNSLDITGNADIFSGREPLDIFIDTRMRDLFPINDMKGCPDSSNWALTLVVFEYEPEENKKNYVSNYAENYSKPL